ncbi:ABC transporter ATP-binding protein [Aquibaculum arenosum]|uniref:ABC transporter ATP-binding protein n=1 Tax=Aquibaculum arenosum TaxID=3032591 RepID=A0ABT5YQS4_9PROT|nr:ABC transporter ATP-binding protein [Fodinicurvata sp. CAU 1616]MDF2097335.1 ABC transporter ATP-binding protein [Fodinicurvata sp. CAU 1616]
MTIDSQNLYRAETGPLVEQSEPLLSVENLNVEFVTSRGTLRAVEGVSYKVWPGEIVALVGESGCGKSVSSLAIMGLLPKPAGRVTAGRILFEGQNLLDLSDAQMREHRGRDVSMIFQEPMTSLNPVLTIGVQIMEPLLTHLNMTVQEARGRALELLRLVGITDPERRLNQYPHQFSGGMRQRVMIAIGLSCNPKLIIADEPTTALDVTIQAQILELMRDLSRQLNIALIIITHNLGIVARYADRVNVMYAGRQIEQARAGALFGRPLHPYTLSLLSSVPRLDQRRDHKLATIEGSPPNLLDPPLGCRFAPRCPFRIQQCNEEPPLVEVEPGCRSACWRSRELLRGDLALKPQPAIPDHDAAEEVDVAPHIVVRNLHKHFKVSSGGFLRSATSLVRAVDGVSFEIGPGETLGLVGESGCGKSTVGRILLGLEEPTEGDILFNGAPLPLGSRRSARDARRAIQVIFQDPYASLNPRMTIGQIIAEPLLVYRLEPNRAAAAARVTELLRHVGLFDYMSERYPHELSGGQRQRAGIARALAMQPDVIVCDEPVSALDVSIQGQIINLLEDLQQRLGLTYLFVAHDLAVVRHISTRVAVMYLGRIVEVAKRDELYANPQHPYTRALLDAAPIPDPAIEKSRKPRALTGELPSPLNQVPGCVFHTRCPLASAACREVVPELRELSPGHRAACIKV